MNCKPGDLARVLYYPVPALNNNEGKIVRCVAPFPCKEPAWIVEPQLHMQDGTAYDGVFDAYLKPIGKPREDEVDEMVVLLGSPQGVTA